MLGSIDANQGDMLLGWGVHDASKSGMEGFLSMYLHLPDSTIFWSAFLGLIGIPLETLLGTSRDEAVQELLDFYATRPEARILFSVAKDATAEDITQAVKIIEALKK